MIRPYQIFLDDLRSPMFLQLLKLTDPSVHASGPWVVLQTMQQAQYFIDYNGTPDFVSFDHDLGPEEYGNGHELAKWMVEQALDGRLDLCNMRYQVHSKNPVGRANIFGVLDGYVRSRCQ